MNAKSGRQASISLKLAQNLRVVSVSYHEASHTIAALLHFIFVSEVAVNKSIKSVSGYANYEMIYSEDEYETIDKKIRDYIILSEIILKNAGLAGEKILYKSISGLNRFPAALKLGTEPDMQSVAATIKKYNLAEPGQNRSAYKKKMFKASTILLEEYWDDVKLIAHALCKKYKLQYEDLKKILTRKSTNKKFWRQQLKNISLLSNGLDTTKIVHILKL